MTLDAAVPGEVEYRYSVKSGEEVEAWADGRRGALRTAWTRVESMMLRHLASVDELSPDDRAEVRVRMEILRENIEAVDLFAQRKIEAAKAEAAAVAAAEAIDQLRVEALSS